MKTNPKNTDVLQDRSSLSEPHRVTVTHLDWDVVVDFRTELLYGTATYTIQRVDAAATTLALDTAHLVIRVVTDAATAQPLAYQEHKSDRDHLGTQLVIQLGEDTASVTIEYATTAQSSAVQWLPPPQTVGKHRPYLFTQCQAIHARSLLPCQDRPGVKMTYQARVSCPSWATCVMSAVLQDIRTTNDTTTCFVWEQRVPISSYLIAMAVGDLTKRDISPRCAVWSEPGLVEAAAYEFAQTEDFLKIAEDLAGMSYQWGRYDLLCLPPSFPFGGMENPCITFVTPTLLAGDRSLADVVAHEIAHSWTGNLVTNATWDHFWLNEGWTTWFQRKIMARIHKEDRFMDFDALGGYTSLRHTVNHEIKEDFTKLVLDIGNADPDESYSTVAYEKGFNLLFALENRVGKEKFEKFFQTYVAKFASKTLTSEDFRDFFMEHFKGNKAVSDIDWNAWLYSPGMPPEEPTFDRSLAAEAEKLAEVWYEVDRKGVSIPDKDISSWSSNQITCFLDHLLELVGSKPLQTRTVHELHTKYNFGSSKNSEILFRYSMLAIAAEDESMIDVILHFVTSQGRMKFTRPIYRALFASKWRDAAVRTFRQNLDFYHPICVKMLANDLKQSKPKGRGILSSATVKWMAVGAAVAVAIGIILQRRR